MLCPACGEKATDIYDTRHRGDYVWRRRECTACGHRFTTHEYIAASVRNPEPPGPVRVYVGNKRVL